MLVIGVLIVMALGLASCDWTMDRYGPEHTGTNPLESAINVGNVSTLTRRFVAPTGGPIESAPAVSRGVLYVGSGDGKLYAFDAAGAANCSGSPNTCSPLWTAQTGGSVSPPSVVNGVVFVAALKTMYAFDAAGTTNCSGTPKTCGPLWTATTGGSIFSATIANGIVYVTSFDKILYAFDAAGNTNCSGSPKTCSPLWTAPTDGVFATPTVVNGVVYTGENELFAFDAAGNTNCSGIPRICSPLWSTPVGSGGGAAFTAVGNGVVYDVGFDGRLYAYDAAGNTSCSGSPKICAPLWFAPAFSDGSPAVANGVVYVGGEGGALIAIDAAGQTNCSGSPKLCGTLFGGNTLGATGAPTIANGVAYILADDSDFHFDRLYAFDAAGKVNCAAATKSCTPLFSVTIGDPTSAPPVVANGIVYVASGDHNIYAYALP